jgi:hypothetical protein
MGGLPFVRFGRGYGSQPRRVMVDTRCMPAWLVVVVVVVALGAESRAGGIVLEAYTQDRPADASRVISPILDELASRGFSAGDTLARAYEAKVSRLAQTPSGLRPDFSTQIDAGFKAWVAGKFDEAIRVLAPVIEDAHANAAVIAREQSLREPLFKGLIALALAQQRTGDPGAARATVAEVLRSYPETVLSRAMYGAEAYELFEQVRREVNASGHGKLTVQASDDSAVVFVDELYRAVGTTAVELVPGEYRVCVLLNKQPSRSHHVIVHANDRVTIEIDPRLDQAVHTVGWTGFEFAAEAEREAHESSYAAAMANALGATAVAVVGIDQIRGRPAVVGSLVSLQTGRELRRASVALEPDPPTERLRALARYLAGDEPAAGLDVQALASLEVREPVHDSGYDATSSGRWGGWSWLSAGVAVAALGTGGYLLYEDGRCQGSHAPGTPCPEVYSNAPFDWIALSAGAVVAGVTVYLFATNGARPAHTAFVAPARGGALAGFTTQF